MTSIYKLLDAEAWMAAAAAGFYQGSPVDLADGFIHFSTAGQVTETARRHFSNVPNLVCLVVDADGLANLRWEPSRGGALFPHLHGPLETACVTHVSPAPLDGNGVPTIALE